LFLLCKIVVVIVVIPVFIALFLYCTYSAIRLSSHKCVINSVCSNLLCFLSTASVVFVVPVQFLFIIVIIVYYAKSST